jgi:hypothetical protein
MDAPETLPLLRTALETKFAINAYSPPMVLSCMDTLMHTARAAAESGDWENSKNLRALRTALHALRQASAQARGINLWELEKKLKLSRGDYFDKAVAKLEGGKQGGNPSGKGNFKFTCFKCGGKGHRAKDCRRKVDGAAGNAPPSHQ